MLNNSLEARIPVSVIIPCYNCETTILRAVKSVVEQTQKPQELIIVNDGSTDDTKKIIKDIQRNYGKNWIKIINCSPNKGPSSARNSGWNAAICPYIAFLDSDDSWHSEKLEVQYSYMSNHPDIALTGHKWILAKYNAMVSSQLPEKWDIKSISKLRFMLISHYFSTPTVMLKKSLSCRFPEDMRYSEDRFLYLKIISEGNKAAYICSPLAYLHKSPYGESGLTKSIWKMEKGELAGFSKLYGLKLLSKKEIILCASFSIIKYLRRRCLVLLKRTLIRSRQ
jgi:glycosyltransferase involved in cell wall biosynthesis